MTWNLFIDDERELTDVTWAPSQVQEKYRNEEWVIARNGQEAMDAFLEKGMPSFISFDHDLGEGTGSGHDIAKMLVHVGSETPVEMYRFPEDFDFYVHSKNPIGKENIEGLLNGYFKAKARSKEVPFDQDRFDEMFDVCENDDYGGDITVGKLK